MLTRENFIGLWAGLPVAWTQDDAFDEKTYRQDVVNCCKAGVPGVYTAGTTGEFYAMEFDEFQAVARATVEECRKYNVPCMIGCSSTYTLGVLRRVEFARQLGADAVQVALPFWMETPDAEVVPFFQAVGKAAGDMAMSIYETMRAKKALTLKQHQEIKAAVPRYIMVKSNDGTLGASPEGCKALSEFVNVFAGEAQLYELYSLGQRGSCSSFIYYNPRVLGDVWKHVVENDRDALKAECEKMQALVQFLVVELAAGRALLDSALDRLGGISSGFLKTSLKCRGPYPSATEKDIEALRTWYCNHWPDMLTL